MNEAPPPPPPPQQDPWAAPTPSIPAPQLQSKRSPAVGIVTVVVTVLVLSAGILAASTVLGGSKTPMLPEAVGSFKKIDSPNVRQATDAFHAQAEQNGLEADLTVYGTASTPRILLAWMRDATVTDPDTALTTFASGFARGFGGSIAMDQKQTQTVEGVVFVCAPVTGNTQAALCLWQQRDVFYVLFDPQSGGSINATLGLSVTAHRAIG